MPPLEPQPPAPPPPELIEPPARLAATTPMMDFFQRRIEMLERELVVERDRASAASSLLSQQEALKTEVEGHLKGLRDQLRHEKAERDGEEAKSHARGRVEALERRLDEMNATFAQLLKEAVSRQSPSAAIVPVEALGAELSVLRHTIKGVADQVTGWRDEMKELPTLLPEVRSIAARIPEYERRLEGHISNRLDQVVRILTATPKAKDEVIVELEAEKTELLKALRERHEKLRAVLDERREIENTMGDSLVSLSGELARERARTRTIDSQTEGAKGEAESFKSRISDLERSLSERDVRAQLLGAERDELMRALVGEAEKVRLAIAERSAADERWQERMLEVQRKAEEETARAGQEVATTSDLRAKVATLSDHMTRALQERDSVVARYADWERERQRLLESLKQKDGMVAMLSSAFQGALKK